MFRTVVTAKMVFGSKKIGNEEIFSMNADGSYQKNLTNNSGQDGYPTWSPDGKKVAFTSKRGSANWEIYPKRAAPATQSF